MEPMITSTANPKIKWLASLHKSSVRREEKLVIVEGAKEIAFALENGLRPHSLFLTPELQPRTFTLPSIEPTYTISKSAFAKVAYRDNSDGVIGVFYEPMRNLENLALSKNPFLLVLEAIEKPGNLGAIVRTANGAGVDAVVICDERCDIWNPNAIRASVGTIFSTPVIKASNTMVLEFLKTQSITPYSAALTESATPYTNKDFTGPTALLLGTEADGLSSFWLQAAETIIIPMKGKNDSLNVSVAAGVLAYEVVRQRG
jgi:RNA methyltransferase, TrmH family